MIFCSRSSRAGSSERHENATSVRPSSFSSDWILSRSSASTFLAISQNMVRSL